MSTSALVLSKTRPSILFLRLTCAGLEVVHTHTIGEYIYSSRAIMCAVTEYILFLQKTIRRATRTLPQSPIIMVSSGSVLAG